MVRFAIRAVVFAAAAALGLVLADALVPDVDLSLTGLLVAALGFAVIQSLLTALLIRVAHRYSAALAGGLGLASTALALLAASSFPDGATIVGGTAWAMCTLVVWLATAAGWWLLPRLLLRPGRRSRIG